MLPIWIHAGCMQITLTNCLREKLQKTALGDDILFASGSKQFDTLIVFSKEFF